MTNRFTVGRRAISNCDICGHQFQLKKLKVLVVRTKVTNVMACPQCWNPDHPQNMQGMYPVEDPQALRNPRPDLLMFYGSESRDIQWGWNPVGFNNSLRLPIPDNLEIQGQVGSVTVVIS